MDSMNSLVQKVNSILDLTNERLGVGKADKASFKDNIKIICIGRTLECINNLSKVLNQLPGYKPGDEIEMTRACCDALELIHKETINNGL